MTKAEILKKIQDLGYPENEVAIPLDDFFNSENCVDAIGVNIYPDPPSCEKFYQVFKGLLSSEKADKIFVRISDTEEPENWFFSDTIYVIGNLTLEELKSKIEKLQSDDICKGWMYDEPVNIGEIQSGQNIYSIWWD